MSMKASPTKIGLFVIIGVALSVAAVMIFGSGKLFSHRIPLVLYFSDSVNGLTVGAPVKFKGVPIGQVTKIQISFDERGQPSKIPVLIEVNEDLVLSKGGGSDVMQESDFFEKQIKQGLRGSLES